MAKKAVQILTYAGITELVYVSEGIEVKSSKNPIIEKLIKLICDHNFNWYKAWKLKDKYQLPEKIDDYFKKFIIDFSKQAGLDTEDPTSLSKYLHRYLLTFGWYLFYKIHKNHKNDYILERLALLEIKKIKFVKIVRYSRCGKRNYSFPIYICDKDFSSYGKNKLAHCDRKNKIILRKEIELYFRTFKENFPDSFVLDFEKLQTIYILHEVQHALDCVNKINLRDTELKAQVRGIIYSNYLTDKMPFAESGRKELVNNISKARDISENEKVWLLTMLEKAKTGRDYFILLQKLKNAKRLIRIL